MKIGPSPSAGIEVAIGSFRPSNFASLEMREPIRPPPITIVSAFSLDDIRVDGVEDGTNPCDEVQMIATRPSKDASGEQTILMLSTSTLCLRFEFGELEGGGRLLFIWAFQI